MQKEMYHCQRVETSRHVIEHNSRAFRKRFQLPHRRWLQNIERTKKYKAREKRFPRQRHCDQSYQLSGDLIDHHKLRIFDS